jgi:hypothetical protein
MTSTLLWNAGYIDAEGKLQTHKNIEIKDRWDDNAKPLCIIGTEPEIGQKINLDSKMTMYIDTYTGEDLAGGEVYTSSSTNQ